MLSPASLLTCLLTNVNVLTCLEVARRLAARMEDTRERDEARRTRVAVDAVHGDRVVAAVGGEHEVATRVDRHAAAPVYLEPAGSAFGQPALSGGSSQRQITPQAAPSYGQPRPTRRMAALAGHTSCGVDTGPHVLSSRGKAEGSVETVCTRLRVGLHERSSSARSCGAVRAKILSISEATSGWYWKTATWFVLGSGLGLR